MLALLRALEALRLDLSLEVLIESRHTFDLTTAEISAEVLALRNTIAHEHREDLLVRLDVVLELAQADLVVAVHVSLSEELICLPLNLIDSRSWLVLHTLKTRHSVSHQHGKFVFADRLRAVEVVKIEDQLGLLVKCGM